MFRVSFKPSFVREAKRLEYALFEELLEKIELLKDKKNHSSLKVHKLHGKLRGFWSFSVTYKVRVVFQFESENEIVLLAVGDHDVYR
jgi:addiction module RelE/StbE family toxin